MTHALKTITLLCMEGLLWAGGMTIMGAFESQIASAKPLDNNSSNLSERSAETAETFKHPLGAFPGVGDRASWVEANKACSGINTLWKSQNYDQAISETEQAITIYPYDANLFWAVGKSYELRAAQEEKAMPEKSKADYQKSVDDLNKGLELNNGWKLWDDLGNSLYHLGKLPESKQALENCLKAGAPEGHAEKIQNNIKAIDEMLNGKK